VEKLKEVVDKKPDPIP